MVKQRLMSEKEMRDAGYDEDEIQMRISMMPNRRPSVSLFDRKKLGAALEEF